MTAEIEMGNLATVNHQRAIKNLVFGLEKLYQSGKIKLEPLPETDIDPGNPESKCPDVILQDNVLSTVPVIVEVATNRGWRTDFAKMRRLIDETEFSASRKASCSILSEPNGTNTARQKARKKVFRNPMCWALI